MPLTIANLIAQLIPLGLQVYNEIRQANPDAGLPPVETILAQADANWDAIAATAKKELNPPAQG